jgi:hypothetical protein
VLIVDLGLFALAVAAIGAAGLRCGSALLSAASLRVLAGASLAAGFVVTETLVLGLFGVGGNAWLLAAAAVVTWLVCRSVAAPAGPALRDQISAAWAQCGPAAGAALGAAVVVGCGLFAFALWRPTYGNDGLSYHGAQPAIWVRTGHPGAVHPTLAFIPTQAYPKTMETLVEWAYAIARTPLGGVPLTVGLFALGAFAVVAGLRRAGVSVPVAGLAAAAAFLVPLEFREINGLYTDIPALAWLACAIALSAASRDEPAVLGPAAVAAGLAIGTKPTVAPFALVALAWGAWANRSSLRALAGRLAAPVLLAVGLGAVWYVEDWSSYGSPLWPFSQFPSGSPTPFIWRTYAARFLDDPLTTMRGVGFHGYFLVLAGGLVLLAALPVLAAFSLLPQGRPVRRLVLGGGALIVVQAVLWADSDFTGLAHGALYLVYAGLRYLTPVFLALAVLLALAARERGVLRYAAVVVLAASVGIDLWQLRLGLFASPLRPSVPVCIGLALIGGAVGAALARRSWLPRVIRSPAVAASLVVVMVAAVAFASNGYLGRYLLVAQRQNYGDAAIVRFLSTQPGWRHGHAPVAAGPEAFASLAGPHFTHSLSLVTVNEPCPAIRTAAGKGWVVITARTGEQFSELDYVHPVTCLAGVTPTATLPGGIRIYAPGSAPVR